MWASIMEIKYGMENELNIKTVLLHEYKQHGPGNKCKLLFEFKNSLAVGIQHGPLK